MEALFEKYKKLSIAVLGDYCLDEYLWIDAALNEPSLETGLVAYQCVKRETYPGAAGTIAKNLANLGVGTIYAVGCAGDDGRGLELCRGLDTLKVDREHLLIAQDRVTPTHTKPWIMEDAGTREMNRIDIKNWTPTPPELEQAVLERLTGLMNCIDALIILDHFTEENCGIVTDKTRSVVAQIARCNPNKIVYADSRCRIARFDNMILKGNQNEICNAVFEPNKGSLAKFTDVEIDRACRTLLEKTGQPVICTMGEKGLRIYCADDNNMIEIHGIAVSGQIDVCGAGDMFTSAFVSALAAGADPAQAGQIGNTAAALCVQQLGTTGHVSAEDIIANIGKEVITDGR